MATSKKNGKSTEELMAPLNALISKGRRDGMLSSSELMAALEKMDLSVDKIEQVYDCLLYTSPSPRDRERGHRERFRSDAGPAG